MSALSTPVEIANLCLVAHYGKQAISSFTQTGVEAQRCAQFYPIALEMVAQSSDWTFLRERGVLALVTNTLPDEWTYAYDMPSRALKLFGLIDPLRPKLLYSNYKIIRGTLFTDMEAAVAMYVTIEDASPGNWPIHFKQAIAAKMAELLAPGFTRRNSDVDRYRAMASQEIIRAIELDASSERTDYDVDELYVYGDSSTYRNAETYDRSTFWRS